MSPDPTAQIAALGVEPTYSAREAALLLGRSYSWLDQRVRAGQFVPGRHHRAAVTDARGIQAVHYSDAPRHRHKQLPTAGGSRWRS